jgi:chemotaxis protein CheX
MMLGVSSQRNAELVPFEGESVTAVVGFCGMLTGACIFRAGRAEAMEMAGRMTGMEFTTVDDIVKDAMGEICNILAGAWKGKVPELAANCGLSVPAVITGRDYHLHVLSPEFRLIHSYRFENSNFAVTIVCDGLQ